MFLIRVNFQIGHELYLITGRLNSRSGTVLNSMDFYCVPQIQEKCWCIHSVFWNSNTLMKVNTNERQTETAF